MTEIVVGKKYYFEFGVEQIEADYLFFIRAICKSNNRMSFINNLNIILSELDINIDDPKISDSTWLIPNFEAQTLERITRDLFKSNYFMYYLEKQLDDDRMQGEWENYYSLNIV